MKQYDAIIIGTGQAGPALAARISREGQRVAIIERKRMGGTCVNVGCIPTKALVASARAAHMARRASDFGVRVNGPVEVDLPAVMARMKSIAGESEQGVTSWLENLDRVDLLRGHASFLDPNTVLLDGESLRAERIFLNVGARAFAPALPGLEQVDYLTNVSMMELQHLPEHLIIVGGSYIGLEFGQIFRRFGSQVTVIERGPRLIGRDDPDVSENVGEVLAREGVQFLLNADCLAVRRTEQGVAVQVACEQEPREVEGSHLLLAVGRVPNTDRLQLKQAGVSTDARGFIQVDDQLSTDVPGIWALGDCNGRGAFTHTSYNDYEIVAANLFDDDPRKVSDRILCYGLFTDPPLGRVGMTEQQALDSGRNVLVGKRLMKHVGRAKERSETDGFIKILVDADSHEILGAAILGVNGDEVVQGLLDIMYAKAPYTVISRAMHIHPTVYELVPTTLQALKPLTRASDSDVGE